MNPFSGYRITSPYGWRNDPFTGIRSWHTGIDLVKSHKAPIYAFVAGEVIHARMGVSGSGFGGFGNVVSVLDSNGFLHCYCHLDACLVNVGQYVSKGQQIGTQGNTGRSTGSHLHYEVRSKSSPSFGFGTDVDPTQYLLSAGKENDEVTRAEYEQLQSQVTNLQSSVNEIFRVLNDGTVALNKPIDKQKVAEWALEAQQYVKQKGISDGERPEDYVRRQEVWTMLERIQR